MSCGFTLDPSESLVVPRHEPQNPNVVTVVTTVNLTVGTVGK